MSQRKHTLVIQAALGGVFRSTSFQQQPPFTLYDSRDMVPVDMTTGRRRVSVRAGYNHKGSSSFSLLATLESAPGESDLMQLMAATSTKLFRYTGGAFSEIGSSVIPSTSGAIHAASYDTKLYIACATPYKYYTYAGHAVASWTATTAGVIPPNCRLVCDWGRRIVLAGDAANPHVVNFSRIDDPHDWDFAEEDTAAPVAVSVNGSVTALIPHGFECLIIGCKDAIWIVRGNPMKGGTLNRLAHVVGPISSKAWCKTPDDWTYMLTRNGLERMPPGCGAPPQSVSREIIPDKLVGVDGVNYKAYLGYDVRWRGIYIFVEGASSYAYWYDIEGGGFWPITPPTTSILDVHHYGPFDTPTSSGTLAGGVGGAWYLDNALPLGGSDKAYFTLGPLKLTQSVMSQAKILEAVVMPGADADDTTGTVKFFAAPTAESAVDLPTANSHSITVGALLANKRCYPAATGHACVLRYDQGDTSKKFSMEEAGLVLMPAGRNR